MAQPTDSQTVNQVERDSRLFIWFLTAIMTIMYAVSVLNQPALRLPLGLSVFTFLFALHIFLHWQIGKFIRSPLLLLAYTLVQGMLGLAICQMAAYEAVTFSIYLALLGEAVGMFGLNWRSLLASSYYLGLAFINIQQKLPHLSPTLLLVMAVPMIVFVVIYVTLYRRQTEAREQAQALADELEAANLQLSKYAARVESLTITAERERIARELHDTLSQGLAGLTLQLEAADAHLSQNHPEKVRQIINQAMQKARETLTDSRRVIDGLRDNDLGDVGDFLHREADRFEAATGLPCWFRAEQTPPLPDSVKEALFRTASEGLTNIARHAQASQAAIELTLEGPNLKLEIKDDGRGFNPADIPAGHYGLLGLGERARLCNGSLDVASVPGHGTTLTLRVPSHLLPPTDHDPYPDRR